MHWALASTAGLKSQGKAQREASLRQINPWEKQSRVLPVHPSIPSIMKNDLRRYSSSPRETARTCTHVPSAAHPKLLFALTVTVAMETCLPQRFPKCPTLAQSRVLDVIKVVLQIHTRLWEWKTHRDIVGTKWHISWILGCIFNKNIYIYVSVLITQWIYYSEVDIY